MGANVGIARKQRVFAKLETVTGTLVFPSGANATLLGFILPAGDAVMNQSPEFVDSPEKLDSLDVINRFEGAMPAGTFTLPMLVRPGGAVGDQPQGDPLFQSLMGKQSTAASAAFATGLAAASIFYKQTTNHPSFSLWVETDHFIQGMSGCTVDQGVLGVNNEGAVMFTFSGQGMQMVWAGSDALAATAASGATGIVVDDADVYSAGAYIQNQTKGHNRSSAGYLISSSNSTNNKLLLASAIEGAWATDDVIRGYLPSSVGFTIGTPIEAVDTTVTIDDVAATFKNTDLTISSPKQYLIDEVGTRYPQEYVEDTRNIEMTLDLYFKKASAKYFAEGYKGNNVPVRLTFGSTAGNRMIVHMEKMNLTVPTVNFTAPTVELSIPAKALGTNGEDSVEIVFN